MFTFLLIIAAVLLDHFLGEPKRFHPLVGFGFLANKLEAKLNLQTRGCSNKFRGVAGVVILVVPLTLLCFFLMDMASNIVQLLCSVSILYGVIGLRSLSEHGQAVKQSLEQNDLDKAREKVGYIVSRETTSLDGNGVCKASIESLLENGSDALFAPLFWFAIAGAPGALCYRLINTLDAMWGYRNDRYQSFGWAAAKLDDLVNWLPARICALVYALVGNTRLAFRCWRLQAPACESPNAGPVMSSGAGALGLGLGGAAIYHGKLTERPSLGEGSDPEASDIGRAIIFLYLSLVVWVIGIALLEWLL